MARDGNGTFDRIHDWTDDAGNAIDISSSRMDDEMDGMATALTDSIAKDGQTNPTANLPMATKRHTGVGNASARTDYASATDIQDGKLNLSTVGGTADVITLTPSPSITAYAAGQIFTFEATGTNTTVVTVNVSAVGAISVTRDGSTELNVGEIVSGKFYLIYHDGTAFQLFAPAGAQTDVPNEWTATQNFNEATLSDGANISWDASVNQTATVTLAGNRTLDNPTNLVAGATYIIRIVQDGTGSRTLAYGSAFEWPAGTTPTLSTDAAAVDIISFYTDGTTIYGNIVKDFS